MLTLALCLCLSLLALALRLPLRIGRRLLVLDKTVDFLGYAVFLVEPAEFAHAGLDMVVVAFSEGIEGGIRGCAFCR